MSSYLPQEIIANILSRLPAKSVQRFRCVCKSWLKLFSSPNFIQLHLKYANQRNSTNLLIIGDDEHVYIARDVDLTTCIKANKMDFAYKNPFRTPVCLGSCNGLVCLNVDEAVICLWNPTTNECKEISVPETCFKRGLLACGLGYDSNNDDYKIVRISYIYLGISMSMEAHVYSLRSDSWKTIEYNMSSNPVLGDQRLGLFLNGALYWVGSYRSRSGLLGNESYSCHEILAFDVCKETFNLDVLKPRDFDGYDYPRLAISALGDSLCMFMKGVRGSECYIDVWVMKDYRVKESLSKLFTIAVDELPVAPIPIIFPTEKDKLPVLPIHNLKNGDILLERNAYEKTLVSYDPKLKSARRLEISGVPECVGIETYLESLVSPKLGNFSGDEEDFQKQGYAEHPLVVTPTMRNLFI